MKKNRISDDPSKTKKKRRKTFSYDPKHIHLIEKKNCGKCMFLIGKIKS